MNGPGEDILIFHWNDREIRIPVHVEDRSSELTLPSGSVRMSGELLEHGDLHAVIAGHKVWASVARYAANLEVFLGGKHLRFAARITIDRVLVRRPYRASWQRPCQGA